MLLPRSVHALAGGGVWAGAENITASMVTDGSAQYLERTPAGNDTTRTRWIFSGWFRRGEMESESNDIVLFGADSSSSNYHHLRLRTSSGSASQKLHIVGSDGASSFEVAIEFHWRDCDWTHIVWSVDTTQATGADRNAVYINGELQLQTYSTTPALNWDGPIGSTAPHQIIHFGYANTEMFQGKSAQCALLQGVSIQNNDHAITDFGDSFTVGVSGATWSAKSDADIKTLVDAAESNCSFLMGSNIHLGTDDSTHGNNMTPTGTPTTSTDSPTDPDLIFSPDGIFKPGTTLTSSLGGQQAQLAAGVSFVPAHILVPPTGKWYVELQADTVTNSNMAFGVCHPDVEQDISPRNTGFMHWEADGDRYLDGTQTATEVSTWAATDVVGLGIDCDSNQLLFYDNAGNLDATVAFSANIKGERGVLVYMGQLSGSGVQKGTLISDEASMSHGVPTGYLALRMSNIPAPSVQGIDEFNVLLYTGDATSNRDVLGANFQPDFMWNKKRSASLSHKVADSTRGVGNIVYPDVANVEAAETGLDSFQSDGIRVDNANNMNDSAATYAAFVAKANAGSTASNSDGDIISTVQAGSFFSIVKWTGNATADQDIGHGLGIKPGAILVKNLDSAQNWSVWIEGMANEYLQLSTLSAIATASTIFPGVEDSSTFRVGSHDSVNGNTHEMIAYVFANLHGVCQCGRYIGNGQTADGPMIFTGFKPRWIMIKGDVGTQEWQIYDTARSPVNETKLYVQPDNSNAEGVDFKDIDILAQGFKPKENTPTINGAGTIYQFVAVADVAGGVGLPPVPGR